MLWVKISEFSPLCSGQINYNCFFFRDTVYLGWMYVNLRKILGGWHVVCIHICWYFFAQVLIIDSHPSDGMQNRKKTTRARDSCNFRVGLRSEPRSNDDNDGSRKIISCAGNSCAEAEIKETLKLVIHRYRQEIPILETRGCLFWGIGAWNNFGGDDAGKQSGDWIAIGWCN